MTVRMIVIEGDADKATVELIRQALEASRARIELLVRAEEPVAPLPPAFGTVRQLVDAAAFHTGLSSAELLGDCRAQRISRVRNAIVLVAREQLGLSLPRIGRALGGRDYTTIIHALRRAGERMKSDPAFPLLVARLRSGIRETANG